MSSAFCSFRSKILFFGIIALALMSSRDFPQASAATSGFCVFSGGNVTLASPADGEVMGGSDYEVSFLRNSGCVETIEVYWAKRSDTGAETCEDVNSWSYISRVENPETKAVWNTAGTAPGDDYCIRLKIEGVLADARSGDFTNQAGGPLLTSLEIDPEDITDNSAFISWQTHLNTSGLPGGDVNTTNNVIIYGTTPNLENSGTTQSTDTGDDVSTHNVELNGLDPNTLYYFKVQSVSHGITTSSAIFTFTTAPASEGLAIHRIDTIRNEGVAGGDFSTGWHFRFYVTANDSSENTFEMRMDDWTNGSTTLPILGNTVYCLSGTGLNFTTEEDIEAECNDAVENDYTGNTRFISDFDAEPLQGGRQFYIDVYYKLPEDAAGVYTTNYGIQLNQDSGE